MKFLLVEENKKEPDYLGEDTTHQDEEDIDYIGLVRKEFESMSSNDIINLLGIPNSSNIDSDSPMFLLPNGSIISVAQAGKLIGQSLEDNIHSDMVYVIQSAIAKKYNYDWDVDDGYYEERKLSYLTYELGWARMNCGNGWTEGRFYCVLPNHMTSSQYRSLEKWLEWGVNNGKEQVLVFVSAYEDSQTYYFDETFPEDIIKKIKRYYSSGRLYENRNELKENMEEPIKDFSKVANPKSGDKLTIIDDKDREWNYVAYLWKAPGFTSGMVWKGQEGNPWINDVAANPRAFNSEFPRGVKKVTINNLNEEFVNELVPGELYHFIHNNKILYGTFKRKTPAWLFFDVEGEEVLAKPWTSVATTTEELEELIGLVDKLEKDTKVPSQVPNRFTRVPNQHNKPMGESNELEQRAKKHKKKSKGMGWHMAVNAGDVEKGIEVFNNSTSLGTSGGEGTAMGEAIDDKTYYYDGPIYYGGNKIASKSNIYTTAKSINIAARNILFKASKGDRENLYQYDIVDHMIKEIPKEETPKVRPICKTCGYELNDIGDCPVCDYGEDDLLESLSDLEALWTLKNLD